MVRLILFIILCAASLSATHAQTDDCAPAALHIGGQARVTPGEPNNLRSAPALGAEQSGVMPGEAVFTVMDGPVCADGYVWWMAAYAGRSGWTAQGTTTDAWIEPLTPPILGEDFTTTHPITRSNAAALTTLGTLNAELPTASFDGVSGMAFSPNGRWFAAGVDGYIVVWDITTGTQIDSIMIPLDLVTPVSQVIISNDARYIVWTHRKRQERTLFFRDRDAGATTWQTYDDPVAAIAYLPYRAQIAVAATDLSLLDLETQAAVKTFALPYFTYASHIAVSLDETLLLAGIAHYAGEYPGRVYAWSLPAGQELGFVETTATITDTHVTQGQPLQTLALTANAQRVIVTDGAGTLLGWHIPDFAPGPPLAPDLQADFMHLALNPADAELGLAHTGRSTMVLIDLNNGTQLMEQSLPGDAGGIQAVFSPDGTILAVAGENQSVVLWYFPQ